MNQDTILSALLDYYSDKASAEASAVIATMFGLFVVLTASGHHPWAALIYWLLWFAGLYFLLGFGYWATHATCAKHFLVGRRQLKLSDKPDRQIENTARGQWKETFLRNLYCFLKTREELWKSKWFHKSENPYLLRLSDLLHILFFVLGVLLSYVFFPDETFSFFGKVSVCILSCVFTLDVVSTVQHRLVRKKRKSQK